MVQVYARNIINELQGCLWTEVVHSAQCTMRDYIMLHWVVPVAHDTYLFVAKSGREVGR